MEQCEDAAQSSYKELIPKLPVLQKLAEDEERHEKELLSIIDEDRLQYIGSMVLGMNDALVELTGALAGLTLAFQNTKLVAAAGLVTGIAASFSMAASEYLSQKSEEDSQQNPLTAAFYTGIAYIVTVAFLVAPYLVFANPYVCLGFTLFNATLVILFFTFYMAIAKDYPFKKRFFEMLGLSMSVAGLSFGIGYIIRAVFGVEV
jgi:VIT1/CCC1 family predicted Fe2+/Mn2+ transporter